MKYKLRPSSAPRFLTCTASVQFSEKPFEENEFNVKGTLLHEVASLRLEQIYLGKDNTREINKLMNYDNVYSLKDPKIKVKWDRYSGEAVDSYVSLVNKIYKDYGIKKIFIEENIKLKFFGNEIYGKVDCALVNEEYLFIIDLKTGRNKVETHDDSQMLLYALGFVQKLNQVNLLPKTIVIGISQEIIRNTELISYSLTDLKDWYVKQANVMWEINNDKLVYRPNEEACRYCVNNVNCNERIKAGIVVKIF